MDALIIVPIIISIGPVLTVSFMINDKITKLWFYYIFGMAGWYTALLLRIPLLLLIQSLNKTLVIILAALLAGIFEETTRFIVLRYIIRNNQDLRAPISLGLGWGFSEAIIVYILNIVLASIIYGYTWNEFLPGLLRGIQHAYSMQAWQC